MSGFKIVTQNHQEIRFNYYHEEAPVTTKSFAELLPFKRTLIHARISGQEIWTDDAPVLEIIQENASVFTDPGEVVFGPQNPKRTKTAHCLGIYYGEGKGLDAANIFAKVYNEDMPKLKLFGESIWKHGEQEVTFRKLE